MSFPSVACILQDKLITKNCMAFDFNAACTGFIYGLQLANSLIKTGEVNNVLLVASEKLSAITDYTDRNTCILFGDGAGAVVLSKTEDPNDNGILSVYTGSDGSKGELLKKHGGLIRLPYHKMGVYDYKNSFLYMDGKAIFKSAINRMTSSLTEALGKANKKLDDLDMIIHIRQTYELSRWLKIAKLNDDQVFVTLPKQATPLPPLFQ